MPSQHGTLKLQTKRRFCCGEAAGTGSGGAHLCMPGALTVAREPRARLCPNTQCLFTHESDERTLCLQNRRMLHQRKVSRRICQLPQVTLRQPSPNLNTFAEAGHCSHAIKLEDLCVKQLCPAKHKQPDRHIQQYMHKSGTSTERAKTGVETPNRAAYCCLQHTETLDHAASQK